MKTLIPSCSGDKGLQFEPKQSEGVLRALFTRSATLGTLSRESKAETFWAVKKLGLANADLAKSSTVFPHALHLTSQLDSQQQEDGAD